VRDMFLHCWKSYSQFAWGQDELRPQSQTGFNWLGNGLGATIVDSLSTMYASFVWFPVALLLVLACRFFFLLLFFSCTDPWHRFVMGLKEEFQTARDWIDQHLSDKIANVLTAFCFFCRLLC
jgi:hypothetical protein